MSNQKRFSNLMFFLLYRSIQMLTLCSVQWKRLWNGCVGVDCGQSPEGWYAVWLSLFWLCGCCIYCVDTDSCVVWRVVVVSTMLGLYHGCGCGGDMWNGCVCGCQRLDRGGRGFNTFLVFTTHHPGCCCCCRVITVTITQLCSPK